MLMEKKYISLLIPLMMYGAILFTHRGFIEYYDIIDVCLNSLFITAFLFFFVRKFEMKRKMDYFCLVVFSIYIFVLYQQVLPFSTWFIFHGEGISNPYYVVWGINLVPFREIGSFFRDLDGFNIHDVRTYFFVGNLLMFAPFAFVLSYFQLMKPRKIILFICFLSVGIEVLQLLQSVIYATFGGGMGRSTDIDDVILNTCSALFGILAFHVYSKISKVILKGKILTIADEVLAEE